MQYRLTAILLIATLLLTACVTAPERPDQFQGDDFAYTRDHMRWMIKEKMSTHDIVGLSIALVDDQQVVWTEGFGFADEKAKIPATPETIYRVGSITKLFTATAVMQLSEQGKLDIDKPLQAYLPHFRIKSRFPDADQINAHNIMTHHSGLPSDRINGMWGDETADFTDLAQALQSEYVSAAPNTIGAYSNLGFSLLGHLVEQVSGKAYEDYLETEILRPTGMRQSYVAPKMLDDASHSRGYFNHKEHATPALRDLPAGGLNSSVVDLARFAQMTFNEGKVAGRTILEPETLTQMQSLQDNASVFDICPVNGLGWYLDDRFANQAGLIARHNGGTPMFFSELVTLPKHQLAVVVLTNSNSAAEVVGEIAQQTLELALESKTGIRVENSVAPGKVVPANLEDLERFPGKWSSQLGLIDIHRNGNRLKLQIEGTKLDLVHRESGSYHPQYKLLGLFPVSLGRLEKAGLRYQTIAGRELLILYAEGKPRMVFAEKISPRPLPAGWENRLGQYESVNSTGALDLNSVELRYSDGILLARINARFTPGDAESFSVGLVPLSDTQAVVHGLGRSKGDTVQLKTHNGEHLLSYSGFLLRKVK